MEENYLKSFDELQRDLHDAKQNLHLLNENIRRVTGCSPNNMRNEKRWTLNKIKRNVPDRHSQKMNEASKFKRRSYGTNSVFHRLSANSSRFSQSNLRPRLSSRVIREMPSRQEIVAAQSADSESRARNRRMFGCLLGTLQKFCQEETQLKQKEDKKAQVEKKLEEQESKEREKRRRVKDELFSDRKRKQMEINKLEMIMGRLKDFEVWESSVTALKGHIRSKTKPYIFYRPRILCKNTEKLLMESQAEIDEEIKRKRQCVNKEINELEHRLQDDQRESDGEGSCTYYTARKSHKNLDRSSKESASKSIMNSEISIIKVEQDYKENKSEPSLNSSIVVVQSTK